MIVIVLKGKKSMIMSIIQYLHWKRDHDYKQINVDSQISYNDWEIIISNVFVFWEHNILEASELKHIFGFTCTHIHMHIYQIFLCFSILKKKDIVIDIDFWHINLWLLLPMSNYIITLHLQNTRWCYHDIYQGNFFLLFKFFLLLFSCSFFFCLLKKKKNDYLLYFLFLSFEIMIGFFLVSLQFLF